MQPPFPVIIINGKIVIGLAVIISRILRNYMFQNLYFLFLFLTADLTCIVCDRNDRVSTLLSRREDMPDITMFVVFEKPTPENIANCKEAGIEIYHLDEIEVCLLSTFFTREMMT